METTSYFRSRFRLLVLAVFAGTLGSTGCGGPEVGTASASRDQAESRPLIPADLKGKAAERAAQPDGRPRNRPGG
jgi:hypothetical protein